MYVQKIVSTQKVPLLLTPARADFVALERCCGQVVGASLCAYASVQEQESDAASVSSSGSACGKRSSSSRREAEQEAKAGLSAAAGTVSDVNK